jgi:hypothetical protein
MKTKECVPKYRRNCSADLKFVPFTGVFLLLELLETARPLPSAATYLSCSSSQSARSKMRTVRTFFFSEINSTECGYFGHENHACVSCSTLVIYSSVATYAPHHLKILVQGEERERERAVVQWRSACRRMHACMHGSTTMRGGVSRSSRAGVAQGGDWLGSPLL